MIFQFCYYSLPVGDLLIFNRVGVQPLILSRAIITWSCSSTFNLSHMVTHPLLSKIITRSLSVQHLSCTFVSSRNFHSAFVRFVASLLHSLCDYGMERGGGRLTTGMHFGDFAGIPPQISYFNHWLFFSVYL